MVAGLKSSDSSSSLGLQSSLSMDLMPPPLDQTKSFNDGEFVNHMSIKRSRSIRMTCYSLADLQTATGNFAMGRLIGEGTIGRVYRAKCADGKVFSLAYVFLCCSGQFCIFFCSEPWYDRWFESFDQISNEIIHNRSLTSDLKTQLGFK